jgi:hypothetical protein
MIVVSAIAIPARIHLSGGVRLAVSSTQLVKSVRAVEGKDTKNSRLARCNSRANLRLRQMKVLCDLTAAFGQDFDTTC